MTIEQMRIAIAGVYPNQTWSYRVDCMPDNQVVAIWHKFAADGKFDPRKKPKKPKGCFEMRTYDKQYSIFDLEAQTVQDILIINDFSYITIFDMSGLGIHAYDGECIKNIPEDILSRPVKSWETQTIGKNRLLDLYI